jgi:hypothetical protein
MNAYDLEHVLRHLDKQGVWLVSRSQFGVLFPNENTEALKKSLARHCKAERLLRVAQGLYANPNAHSKTARALEALVPQLRPLDFNYLSAETVLAERSVISQMTQNYLTVMTTGASKRYQTPYGTIEFTHTKRDYRQQLEQMSFDEDRGLWVANTALAYRDLKRLGRNTNMVDTEDLSQAIEEDTNSLTQRQNL